MRVLGSVVAEGELVPLLMLEVFLQASEGENSAGVASPRHWKPPSIVAMQPDTVLEYLHGGGGGVACEASHCSQQPLQHHQ